MTVVGVNSYTESERSPLGHSEQILKVDPEVEPRLIGDVERWRAERDHEAVAAALADLDRAARSDINIMGPTIAAARAGVTTGEWAETLRSVFGQFRAPTGIDEVSSPSPALAALAAINTSRPDGPPRLLIAKPGLDGHSNGAEQVSVAARDGGLDVAYDGIRVTPEEIAHAAVEHRAEMVAVSILSGAHMQLVPQVMTALNAAGVDVPVVVGGIIPEDDQRHLADMGVVRVYTPKNYELAEIVKDMTAIITERR
jgi:ethylmalonyl-CoA mutase